MSTNKLSEGIEFGDLKRLVDPKLSIDEYRSKMGDDKDIVVLSMVLFGKAPAEDLVNFVEKSFDFVLDSDVSSGETSDGNYMVFIELERNEEASEKIIEIITDLLNLTGQKISDWSFTYFKHMHRYPLTLENLQKSVWSSPEEYERNTSKEAEVEESRVFNNLRALSGIPVKTRIITDPQILGIQIAAGIR
jgi:hypothetical protein